MKGTRVTAGEKTEMIRLYTSGMSIRDVAGKMNRSYNTVSIVLREDGIKPNELWNKGLRKKKNTLFTRIQDKLIRDEYLGGASLNELAAKYSCSLSALIHALKRENTERRPRGNTYRVYTDLEIEQIMRLYTVEKLSQAIIARKYHTHQIAISKILRMNGIEHRERSGEHHGSWKGGRSIGSSGYMLVRIQPNHKYFCMAQKNRYVGEHRLVMAERLGRPLASSETVHHINGLKTDNRPDNLELRHGKHGVGICYECADCGSRDIREVALTAD